MPTQEPENLTFEQAQAQMEAIATAIEQGKIGLEESIVQYEKAMKLYHYCRSVLSSAEARIQQLQLGENGKLTPVPMEPPPGQ